MCERRPQYKTSNQTHEGLQTRKLRLTRENLTKVTHKKWPITDLNSELSPEPVMSLHKLCIRRFLDESKIKAKALDNLKAKRSACCPSSVYTRRSQGS